MGYSPNNNPYIPGDPYSYDLKWIVSEINRKFKSVGPESITEDKIADGAVTKDKLSESLQLLTIKDYVTPEMFGAKGDGLTDDTSAVSEMFAYAIAKGVDVCINNKYVISQKMVIETPITMTGSGRFIYNGNETTGYVFTFGKENATTAYWNIKMYLTNANQDLYGISGIRIVNSLHGTFDICATYFADGFTLDGYTKDCDYNLVYPKYIASNLRNIVLIASGNGAVNQNTFVGGSCRIDSNIAPLIQPGDDFYDLYIKSSGSNIPNNNTFVGVSFESTGTPKNRVYSSAHNTQFLNCRYEGVSIYEDSDTLGSRYIDGFNMYGSIESLHASSQYMTRDRQYLCSSNGYTNRLQNASDTFAVTNSSNVTVFSVNGSGEAYIRSAVQTGSEIGLQNGHSPRTKITAGDTVPSYSDGFYASVHLNSSSSNNGKRALIREGSAWENLLYTYAKPSTDRPTGVRVGYTMFDTTLNKPIWHKGSNVWVDATGATV